LEDVEKNLWEMVIRWRQKTVDREEQASEIKDEEALRHPSGVTLQSRHVSETLPPVVENV
jgi:hypothetical protein